MDDPPLWETEIPTRTSTGASLGFCSFVEASAHPHRRPDERLSQLKPARPQDIGSLLRLAMAWFRGLKIGRGYLREMGRMRRALVSTQSPEELADAARQQGMLIWLMRRLHCDLKETLIDARLQAHAFSSASVL